jgi:hypothetical protein
VLICGTALWFALTAERTPRGPRPRTEVDTALGTQTAGTRSKGDRPSASGAAAYRQTVNLDGDTELDPELSDSALLDPGEGDPQLAMGGAPSLALDPAYDVTPSDLHSVPPGPAPERARDTGLQFTSPADPAFLAADAQGAKKGEQERRGETMSPAPPLASQDPAPPAQEQINTSQAPTQRHHGQDTGLVFATPPAEVAKR